MSNIKHSKYKNTFLMNEFLTRQAMSDVVFNKIPLKESKAFGLIKKYFDKTLLSEELNIYSALINTKFNNTGKSGADFSANYLIKECMDRHSSLSQKELRRLKYNLVKEIKESYDIEKLFSTSVSQYKEGATVYALLEANRIQSPVDKAKYSGIIFENITKPKRLTEAKQIDTSVFKDASKDEINLAFNMLVRSFNKTYGSVLNENQKKLIRDYVYSPSNESNWIKEHFTKSRLLLNKKIGHLSKSDDSSKKVIRLKLQECESKLNTIAKNKIITEDKVLNKIMAVYSLVDLVEKIK